MPSWDEGRRDAIVGWSLWLVLIVVLAGIQITGNRKSVTNAYADGARGWLQGGDLYSDTGHGFLYLPVSAIILSPLAIVPGPAAEIAWRILTVGVFAAGTWVAARQISACVDRPAFALASLVGVVLAFPAARNGQATLPMAGFLIFAVHAAMLDRLAVSAVAATAALAMKPLALPIVLVIGACRPRVLPWLMLGIVVLLAFPYLTADPGWVTRQYVGFRDMLARSDRMSHTEHWATFFGIFRAFGLEVSSAVRALVQGSTAATVAALAWIASRRLAVPRATLHVYALASLWLLLFSPRTENNTYACLAPVLTFLMALPRPARWADVARMVACIAIGIAVIGSYEIGKRLVPGVQAAWLAPLATSFLVPLEGWRLFIDLRHAGIAPRLP